MRRSLTGALALGVVVLVVLWLMFQHRPGWYQPVTVDDAAVQRAQASAARLVDRISDRLAVGEPVEAVLAGGEVNEWLASLPQLWPEAGQAVPEGFSDLAVGFERGQLRIGAHLQNGQVQAIMHLSLAVELAADRARLKIRLVTVRSGALPVPRTALEELLERFQSTAEWSEDLGAFGGILSGVQSVEELFDGIEVHNRFVWPNGDRPFRISSITSEKGALRIKLEPI
ncbi:MAG: hypothetical protein JSU63_11525 [Phycisphaerales bacterium]|nr:MAG: hypothetical protein JSU63_11525 [Phycisphaerales bacterium]